MAATDLIVENEKLRQELVERDKLVSSPNFMVHPSRSVMGCDELSQSWHFKSLANTVFEVEKSINP